MPVKTPGTVTLKDFAASVAEDNELSKKAAEDILAGLVGNIVGHLKKGRRVRLGGLGTLQVRNRAARMGRNPATGAVIQIDASKNVVFRANSELRAVLGSLVADVSPLPGKPDTRAPLPGTDVRPLPGGKPDTRAPLPGGKSSSTKKSGA